MGQGRKTSIIVELFDDERQKLLEWQRSTTISAGLAKRGRVILLLSDKIPISHIAVKVGMRRDKIAKWGRRFIESRIDGLSDKKGRGRKPFFPSGGCH